jgi:hypothetical protein
MENWRQNGTAKKDYVEEKSLLNGLTKREYFAVLAMQGMLVNGGMTQGGSTTHSPNGISELAVLHADALLEALSKP